MTTKKTDSLKVKTLEITDKIIFSGSTPKIQIKNPTGTANPLVLQIVDSDGAVMQEFVVNGDGAGNIKRRGSELKV